MRINHNISALNTHRQLSVNNAGTARSLEKLSSGLRINRAGDDAAGLAISEKMRGQVRGLHQGTRNAQDGISLIQTAEGALNETHSILQRMRELAVQSANDTNTTEDRRNIQDEMNQMNREINRISSTTQFNTKNLIDGSMGVGVNAAVANVNANASLGTGTVATTLLSALTDRAGNSLGIIAGDVITATWVRAGVTSTASLTVAALSDAAALLTPITGTAATYSAAGVNLTSSVAGFSGATHGLTINVRTAAGAERASATNALSSFSQTVAAADLRADGQATFHIGSNTGQNMQLSLENMSTSALGVSDIQVMNQGQANVAIRVIDGAIQRVSAERSLMGAVQNRLEHTINNLGTSAENLTAAESRIRDVDMAQEMMEFTKNNILSQAAQAMLAQANQQPQGVLQLLR
ncbi:MAG: A-type flagellin [Firmicutes bacterium]|nr:A-type flagellin [candidate division NPL-UPA2 bacterium]